MRTTLSGNAGGETVSPLAATAPLTEQHGITSELDSSALQFTTPPQATTDPAFAATLLTGPAHSESGEITIPVVRPTSAQLAAPETTALNLAALPSTELLAPPLAAAPAPPLSVGAPSVVVARQPPERRALRIWLVAGLLGGLLLLCLGGASALLWLRARPASAPVASTDTPIVTAPADARQSAQAKFAEAQALLAAGDPVAATARLREAIALDPANTEAHRQLAGLLLESGARETALDELRAVTRLEPNDKDAWRQLAETQFAAGQYAAAADSYHMLMDVSSEALADDRLQLAYADALRLAGRVDNARALYRRLAASPLADVARTSKQRLLEASAPPPPNETASAPKRNEVTTVVNNAPPASLAPVPTPTRPTAVAPSAPVALSPAEHFQRGVELWSSKRAAAATEFRAAASAGNADAYYYLGLSLAEGRDPHALGRAELVAALDYFQRARASRFSAQARRYEDQLGQEFDRRRKQ